MTLGYYPGCSMHGTSKEFDESLKAVLAALDVPMAEIDDWNCCGASSAHATDHLLGVALPARNLALAEAQGFDEVLAPCAACYNRLSGARHAMATEPGMRERIPELLQRPFQDRVAVRNVVEFLLGQGPAIEERVGARLEPNALAHLSAAAYYGCLLVRPAEITGFDDSERPTSMEGVISACGARPVAWNMAVECCGGAFSISRTSSVVRLSRAIIQDARRAGAEAIVVACPLCHSNLDFRQAAMTRRGEEPMPILFVTQLVGLALGLPAEALGFDRHFVSTRPLLAQLKAAAARAAEEAGQQASARAARAAAKSAAAAGAAPATGSDA